MWAIPKSLQKPQRWAGAWGWCAGLSLELGGEPLLGLFERFGDFSFLVVEAELVEGGLQVGVDPVQAFVFGGDARKILLGVLR